MCLISLHSFTSFNGSFSLSSDCFSYVNLLAFNVCFRGRGKNSRGLRQYHHSLLNVECALVYCIYRLVRWIDPWTPIPLRFSHLLFLRSNFFFPSKIYISFRSNCGSMEEIKENRSVSFQKEQFSNIEEKSFSVANRNCRHFLHHFPKFDSNLRQHWETFFQLPWHMSSLLNKYTLKQHMHL